MSYILAWFASNILYDLTQGAMEYAQMRLMLAQTIHVVTMALGMLEKMRHAYKKYEYSAKIGHVKLTLKINSIQSEINTGCLTNGTTPIDLVPAMSLGYA